MKRENIASILYRNSTDSSEGLTIKFENIANVINLLCNADMPVPKSEKDYEILSFVNRNCRGIWELINEGYQWKCDNDGSAYSHDLEYLLDPQRSFTIHSVRRLSDGEVFTVGRDIKLKGYRNFSEIESIHILDDKIILHTSNKGRYYLKNIENITPLPVLLKTEDGVEVISDDTILYVCYKTFVINTITAAQVSKNQDNKYFSTAAARDGYIFYNKPITTTCKEIENVLDGNLEDCYLEKLMAFFKAKQNNS